MDDLRNAIEAAAPAPLAPLTQVIISPANIAAEQREREAKRLSWSQRRKASSDLKRLDHRIRQLENALAISIKIYLAVEPKIRRWRQIREEIADQLSRNPDDAELQEELAAVETLLKANSPKFEVLSRKVAPWREAEIGAKRLKRQLDDHAIAVQREETENKLFKAIVNEAKIYERLIVHKWNSLGYCERFTKGKKEITRSVKFASVHITLDAIYFKIDASFQTAFKNWKTNLPISVRITDQLLAPLTLDELSITCQRQITGQSSPAGAWVIVHRLDSVDGLMNYVSYRDVMTRYPGEQHNRFPVCAGVGANRVVKWVNLSDYPHWLIGGYTNSGKSNMVNVGICTLISKHTPEELRLVLIDLKGGLEFSAYEAIPHLHGKIVTEVQNTANSLEELMGIMDERFRKFRQAGQNIKTIDQYRLVKPDANMPRLLCVFDEVASILDWGDTTKRIIAVLRQIVAKGRAVGIHVWLCTQRPDVKVVEGAIKANLALRLTGRLPSSADSVTILGNSMAKDLAAIPGRMILQYDPDPQPVQTPHITDEDMIQALTAAVQMQPAPAIDIPASAHRVDAEWTVERVIELSIVHLNGNITAKAVRNAADDLSQRAAQKLVEKIWQMDNIEFNGHRYELMKGEGHIKRLVATTSEPV
jgi:S-DNA-T family DNA segregation ATPase FtsK/SpoIIIE